MGFKKMTRSQYPPRLWSIVGYPRAGKSTFAAQMKGPMVVVDADHRFQEVLHLSKDEVYELSETRSDNVDPNQITSLLNKNMPGSGVQTVVVDSLTAIITPLVVQAMVDNENGKARNLSAAFKTKALAMRQIQDAVTRWGTDVLWIYHLQDSRDARAKEVTRATISDTELARLSRSINVQLEMIQEEDKQGRRGIKVVWSRRGRSNVTLWDDTGCWEGMPEKIEEAIYDGLSADEQDRIESASPDFFPNPEAAISWGMDQGAYDTVAKAKKAYNDVKKNQKPANAKEMAQMWVEHVEGVVFAASNTKGKDAVEVGGGDGFPEAKKSGGAKATSDGPPPVDDEDCPF